MVKWRIHFEKKTYHAYAQVVLFSNQSLAQCNQWLVLSSHWHMLHYIGRAGWCTTWRTPHMGVAGSLADILSLAETHTSAADLTHMHFWWLFPGEPDLAGGCLDLLLTCFGPVFLRGTEHCLWHFPCLSHEIHHSHTHCYCT